VSKYIVAITGASGVIYGLKLISELIGRNHEVHVVVSEPGELVLAQEMGWPESKQLENDLRDYLPDGNLYFYKNNDIGARIASGSFIAEAMLIVPCTMSTVASVANGMSNNLIERTSDVMLKEKRTLILMPRETPLSSVHLRNMLSLADMGVSIVPAMPAFYHQPDSVDDMVLFMVGKILDLMKIPHDIFRRYEGITTKQ
jgi:4-hydroxy-3-polyprenylbenzoate decarboxylase